MAEEEERRLGPFVGMPAWLYLEQFGSIVWDAFGDSPYLVGSALTSKQWRDVDVRLILDADAFSALFPDWDKYQWEANSKWVALCMAFSALGQKITGLPIDFQIQPRSFANQRYRNGQRHFLGLVQHRIKASE